MKPYIVSARKYRPNTFGSVVGQGALTTTLKNAIGQSKLAHAYLFCGPRGVGKTTCARIFAKTINCLTPTPEGDCCGTCESCRAFDEQRSYNIHELDAASNNSVDDIRMLCEQAQVPPQVGQYKVFIIDEVHMLSQAAFNAFLKTLEEPPSHAVFILATTEKHKILPTILSRCQIYDFNRMEVEDTVAHLRFVAEQEGIAYEETALNIIAQKADGGMRDALSIFDQVASFSQGNITYEKTIQNLNVLDYEYYFRMTDCLLQAAIPAAMLLFNEILSKGFAANHFIGGFASHLRDLLVSREPSTLPLLQVAEAVRSRYSEQAQRCTPKWLYRALRLCNNCDLNYRSSNNKRLLVELTLIEVAQEDEPACGRSPKKILSPVFESSPTAVAATPAPAPVAAPQPQRPTVTPPTTASPPSSSVSSVSPATSAAKPMGIRKKTIRIQAVKTAEIPAAASTPAAAPPPSIEARHKFTTEDLRREWLRFSHTLPARYNALKARMRVYLPEVTTLPATKVIVEGEQVKAHLQEVMPDLLPYLRKELQNGAITMDIEIAVAATRTRPTDKRELYQQMLQKSPAMLLLQKELKLEFY